MMCSTSRGRFHCGASVDDALDPLVWRVNSRSFCRRRAPYDAQPILAELARFEWALTEVFDGGDAPRAGT